MVKPHKSIIKRCAGLKQHLERESPALVSMLAEFQQLDKIAYNMGLLRTDQSYVTQIPWWPVVSILGVFSAGKSSFINSYLGASLQKTGNQAVDDKFTVLCFGQDSPGRVLPGMALDADTRFPFYRISEELEKVATGEGRRIDAYLQLKITDSPAIKGKIFIDSPGFDADDQRRSTLRLTDHIMDISDLVLVFFDARHPEPGAMQDTLNHLVANAITRSDTNKFLFVLNQIDTAAREDNTEEIVGAWQRALSHKGLTTGRFYTIYNSDIAPPIENDAARQRFEARRNADMSEIEARIQQVESERVYRIAGALENDAIELRDTAVHNLTGLKNTWAKRVLRYDLIVLVVFLVLLVGASVAFGFAGSIVTFVLSLLTNPMAMLGAIGVIGLLACVVHFAMRHWVANSMIKTMRNDQNNKYENAFRLNTRFYRSLFRTTPAGWNKRAEKAVESVLENGSEFVQNLNDQYATPSG